MKRYAVYDADGTIVGNPTCMPYNIEAIAGGYSYMEVPPGTDDSVHYIAGGVVADKAAMTLAINKTTITADGVDEAIISGVPTGSKFDISGPVNSSGVCTDGSIEFSTTAAGTYTVLVTKAEYITELFTIEAT